MALVMRSHPASSRPKSSRALIAAAGCLALGACAQGNNTATDMLSLSATPEAASEPSAAQAAAQVADNAAQLRKATEYWGQEFAKNPRELQPALSYARNLKAMGEKQRALAVLQQAAMFHGNSRELAGEYGRLALDLDQVNLANKLLAAADDPAKPDWRVISARGTVLAKQGKYGEAIPFYERALSLAHDHPSVLSNLALAHAMNGEPDRAEVMLRQAAAADRNSLKIRQNLALVLGLQGKYAEGKLLASHDLSPENAAENADYLRRVVKLAPDAQAGGEATQVAQKDAGNSERVAPLPPQITGAIDKKPSHKKHGKEIVVPAPAGKDERTAPLQVSFTEPEDEGTRLTMSFADNLPRSVRGQVRAPEPKKASISLAPSLR